MRPTRILFVCLGNICRSPAAEIVFRRFAAESGRLAEFEIDSAGTIGYHEGAPPDSRMAGTLREKGYTVTGASRKIRSEDLDHFDLILTMDEENLAAVRKLDPRRVHHGKIRSFVDFCSDKIDVRVPDPYYGGQRGFDYVVRLLENGCKGVLAHLAPHTMAG